MQSVRDRLWTLMGERVQLAAGPSVQARWNHRAERARTPSRRDPALCMWSRDCGERARACGVRCHVSLDSRRAKEASVQSDVAAGPGLSPVSGSCPSASRRRWHGDGPRLESYQLTSPVEDLRRSFLRPRLDRHGALFADRFVFETQSPSVSFAAERKRAEKGPTRVRGVRVPWPRPR